MSDISGSGSLQFWQAVAGVVGTGLAAFAVGIGRRAGALARRSPEVAASGDALQRQILEKTGEGAEATRDLIAEIRGLRGDWRELRDHLEDRFDDLRHGQSVGRRGQTDVKVLLRELIDRLPERGAAPRPDAADLRPDGE